ncbi:DHH family phosphoesterase [Erysipelothrix sp. HDW6C]|uniref:DHH family phosphoesterase n=1 Tax=Erysipelothrix sp. HDW6C TaxID=2714930 RepID=UPI001408C2F7|nr:DHH family phosphoesterase [Erysipelothrix sp. HDW6C]QIK68926.1 DHH family phosphoesterase [Erysipelothrix sp. HDW6C]
MSKRFETLQTRLLVLVFIELVIMVLFHVVFNEYLYIVQYIALLVNMVLIFVMFYNSVKSSRERILDVADIVGAEAQDAFEYGKITVLTLNEDARITWISDGLVENAIGESVRDVFPEVMKLINGKEKKVRMVINDKDIEATIMNNERVIFFKDVTKLTELERLNRNNSVVLGIAHLDNYEETTQYEEEQIIALIDMNIRQAVVRWADKHDMFIRRIRADRYLLVLNEEVFQELSQERFSILHEIRKEAAKMDASITLSLAFARQSDNLKELEDMSNKALELAQGRGGDQVAINTKDSEMTYFGGSTEAVEKRSKVRVRVMAQNLGEIINNSTEVVIVGHRMTDFDCFASALGVAAIADVYGKRASIVINLDDTEANLADSIRKYREDFEKDHNFISHSQALDIINEKTLVIMVDHHSLEQTQFPDIIAVSQRIAVIDHHRRTGEFQFKPILTYIESSASSASELIVELFPYHRRNVVIGKLVATFMYTGMIIDTNRFRNRSGSRTFQAAAELRKFGADLAEVENMLRDDYEDFEMKNKILATSKLYDNYYVIAAYKHETLPRTMLSQAADEILSVREVEASFVLAPVGDDAIGISARSKGELNVQVVMERLGGGGHFTGAATIIRNQSMNDIVEQLQNAIEEVREESE